MKHIYILFFTLIFTLFSQIGYSQGEGNNWYFGNHAGLNFSTDPPTGISGGQMNTNEGCSSISDFEGNLLFYTDGSTVWSKDHSIMQNGTGLLGDASSTQSGVIVPHSGDPNIYYIFTVDEWQAGLVNGFNYSKVNLTANDGLGEVVLSEKNIRLVSNSTLVCEKVTAVKHGSLAAYWVITHEWNSNNFFVFQIGVSGINVTEQTFPVGTVHGPSGPNPFSNARGYLKASPEGNMIAVAPANQNFVEVFDFNNETGEISNPRQIFGINDPYGLEFSLDQSKLYVSELAGGRLLQIDFNNADFITVIDPPVANYHGAIQVAPNGKLYISIRNQNKVAVINDPDEPGALCNFDANGPNLAGGTSTELGLPTFISSFFLSPSFIYEYNCLNDTTLFTLETMELPDGESIDSVFWNFGDPAAGADSVAISTVDPFSTTHVFPARGDYVVSVQIKLASGSVFPKRTQIITIFPLPVYDITDFDAVVQDTFHLCDGEEMKFKVTPWGFANAFWSNGSSGQVSSNYSTSGNVIVNVQNTQGCTLRDTTYLEVSPPYNITMTIPDFCEGDDPIIVNDSVSITGGIFTGLPITFVDPDYILDPTVIPLGGSNPVFYEYTDTYGCVGSQVKSVHYYAAPIATLSMSQDTLCEDGTSFTLDGGLPAGGDFLLNGSLITDFDPVAEGIGSHDILYAFVNTDGCSDTALSPLVVTALPLVTFAPVDTICQNNGIFIIDQGAPTGGGGIGTYSGPQIDANGNFDSNTPFGTYNLVYQYEDANGCMDTAQRAVYVEELPQAATSATVDISAYCIDNYPGTITLECVGPNNSYVWYADDFTEPALGNTKILTIPAPTVTTNYLVRSETSCGESAEMSVTVTVYDSPVSDFSLGQACETDIVVFSDLSSIASGAITAWEWDFGDGSPVSNLSNPNHTYAAFSNPTVTLTVTSDNSCQTTFDQVIDIHDKPIPNFTFNNVCLGDPTDFANTSTAPLSNITTYDWEIEGLHYFTQNASHTFSAAGNFNVILTVGTEHGCEESITKTVSVTDIPIVDFDYFNPCRSNVVELTNNSLPNGSPLDTYLWDFNNGDTSPDFELTYIYPAAGIYNIDLTVTDVNGCTNSTTRLDVIVSPDFDVSISSDVFCIDVEGAFHGDPIPDFLPMNDYEWLFPDGSIDNGQDVNYTFTSAGVYEIGLVGTLGTCTAGKTYIVEVKELPAVNFTNTGSCLESPILFSDGSSGDGLALTAWSWDFGDSNTSILQNPQNTFISIGTYPVQLTVTDANNCINTQIIPLTLRDLPTASFSPISPYCEDETIAFTNTSTGPGSFTDFLWEMEDGSTYTTDDISHTFALNGDQDILI